MVVARIIGGIGNGLNTATAPVWQTETSQVKWRGKLVVIELIMNIAGFSLSNWMTYGFSYVGGPISWRFPLAFQMIFIFILFGTVPWLPESPRWLIAHEYEDEAFTILADLENKDSNDPFILAQHREIVYTVQYERENAPKWSDLLRGRTSGGKAGTCTIRRLLLGAGTQFMQQFSGINVTSYYLPTGKYKYRFLLEERVSAGFGELLAEILSPFFVCTSIQLEHPLTYRNSLDQLSRFDRGTCSSSSSVQFGFLPAFLVYRCSECGTLGSAKDVDVRCSRPGLLLRYDHDSTWSKRSTRFRSKEASCFRLSRILLPILRLLRHRFPGRAVALSHGDQLARDANKRCRYWNSNELDVQFHCRGDHTYRHSESRLALLYHLGGFQLGVCPDYILPLPRNCWSYA